MFVCVEVKRSLDLHLESEFEGWIGFLDVIRTREQARKMHCLPSWVMARRAGYIPCRHSQKSLQLFGGV